MFGNDVSEELKPGQPAAVPPGQSTTAKSTFGFALAAVWVAVAMS